MPARGNTPIQTLTGNHRKQKFQNVVFRNCIEGRFDSLRMKKTFQTFSGVTDLILYFIRSNFIRTEVK